MTVENGESVRPEPCEFVARDDSVDGAHLSDCGGDSCGPLLAADRIVGQGGVVPRGGGENVGEIRFGIGEQFEMFVVNESELIDRFPELADVFVDLFPEVEFLFGGELGHFAHFAEVTAQGVLFLFLCGALFVGNCFFGVFRKLVKAFTHGAHLPCRRRRHDRNIVFNRS